MNNMKLYICGPVSMGGKCTPEQEAENIRKFHAAERTLIAAGYQTENPADVLGFCIDRGLTLPSDSACPSEGVARWQWYMRRTLIQMLTCHGVAVLEGAVLSRGCQLEMSIAKDLGLFIKPVAEWIYLAARVPEPAQRAIVPANKCEHKNGVTNQRPWKFDPKEITLQIGECVDCGSTIEVGASAV